MKARILYCFMVLAMFFATATIAEARPKNCCKAAVFQLIEPQTAFAQEVAPPSADPVEQPSISDSQFMMDSVQAIMKALADVKQEGMAKVTIFLIILLSIAQILIQFTKTAIFGRVFKNVNHLGKLAIVSICTVVTTLVPLLLGGMPLLQALSTGAVLTAIMVAINQVYQGLVPKK